ncbi:hypothetical protein EMIT0P44_20110 [Pseudomonas sp. IT-P44]
MVKQRRSIQRTGALPEPVWSGEEASGELVGPWQSGLADIRREVLNI